MVCVAESLAGFNSADRFLITQPNPLSPYPAKTPEKMAENRGPATKSQVWPEDRKRKVQHRTSETRGTTAPIFAVGPDRNADVCYELWAFLYGLFLT
jgi:hypothetical protein